MLKSTYLCTSCHGRFEIARAYEQKEEDIPHFCPWCGTKTAQKEHEAAYDFMGRHWVEVSGEGENHD